VFTDPPYNVAIDGNVCGLGRTRHREFAMGSGEMSEAEFATFLQTVFGRLAEHTVDGSIHQVCMDWRHMWEMLAAGRAVYSELKNLCVWNKANAGMGSFYRSKHELIFVWKNGGTGHINNFELGQHGRNRTNVWDYAGVNSLRAGRLEELAMHPTVKPVALVADAIKDCSDRGSLVLDPFCGSGTSLIAAERTGRKARSLEIDRPMSTSRCGVGRPTPARLPSLLRQGKPSRQSRSSAPPRLPDRPVPKPAALRPGQIGALLRLVIPCPSVNANAVHVDRLASKLLVVAPARPKNKAARGRAW
jgi:DNA methylase